MESLIHDLNAPSNQGAPERINEIQKQIQQLQRQKAAWQQGLDFLQHRDSVVRFYGALTLTVKIHADWDSDDFDSDHGMRTYLLEALLNSYVRLSLSGDPDFVLQKLCSTLAALHHRLGSDWQSPVRHILACLISQNVAQQQGLPEVSVILSNTAKLSTRQLEGAIRLASTLAEDLGSSTRSNHDRTDLRLSDSCLDVFQLLLHCISSNNHGESHGGLQNGDVRSATDSFNLSRRILKALPLWIAQLKPYAVHASKTDMQRTNAVAVDCTRASLRHFEIEADELLEDSLQCLLSIQQLSPRMLTKADAHFPRSFATLPVVQKLVSSLQQGDGDSCGVLFVDLLEAIMTQVDLSTPAYILSGRYAEVLQFLLHLLNCTGVAMVEDTVCQVVLETIIMIIEGYTDWNEDENAFDYLKAFVRTACESCLTKIKIPSDEMFEATHSWDADDRARFHDFRLDVQDFLQSAFTILGDPLLQAIVQSIVRDTSEATWSDFEASLFCLMAFSDTMNSETELYGSLIEATLNCVYFKMAIQSSDVPDKARNTSIRFLTENTAYLQSSPDLMQILNFLFSSLHQPSLISSASRAIYTLCDAQRSSLVQALPQFIGSLSTVSDLHGVERHRIYGGVAAVVQALPNEQAKVQPLTDVLEALSQSAPPGSPDESSETKMAMVTEDIQTLAAIGRGLRAPSDGPIVIDSSPSQDADFWLTGPGSQTQQRVLALHQHQIHKISEKPNSELVEATCDFLRSGFTEDHPSPLKFAAETSTRIVCDNISLHSPNIDAVMACASSLLASASTDEFHPHLVRLFQQVLVCIKEILAEAQQMQGLGESSFPAASLDFVTRLLPRWADNLLGTEDGQSFLLTFTELAILVISEPDTLPRRSAAAFFSALVDVSKPVKSFTKVARHNLDTLIQQQSPRILAVLLRLVGGDCARSELEVLTDPLRRYVLHLPMLFKSICREAMKEESRVLTETALLATTLDHRLRFVSQMDALRGGRKSNDIVKEFWITCRGSSFGYVA